MQYFKREWTGLTCSQGPATFASTWELLPALQRLKYTLMPVHVCKHSTPDTLSGVTILWLRDLYLTMPDKHDLQQIQSCLILFNPSIKLS